MKQRDKGVIVLARLVGPDGEQPKIRPAPIASATDMAFEGLALLYETYMRGERTPGAPTTFGDFIAIYKMAQSAERQ